VSLTDAQRAALEAVRQDAVRRDVKLPRGVDRQALQACERRAWWAWHGDRAVLTPAGERALDPSIPANLEDLPPSSTIYAEWKSDGPPPEVAGQSSLL
jgi:hypothetical protein